MEKTLVMVDELVVKLKPGVAMASLNNPAGKDRLQHAEKICVCKPIPIS